MAGADTLLDIVIPIIIMVGLFVVNGAIFLMIMRQRRNK